MNTPLQWPDYILRGTLINGMKYFIMDHKNPQNRILTWLIVEAGAVHETEKETGIAHYLEHMAFKGSKYFPGEEKYFQGIGVSMGHNIDACVLSDITYYYIEIPGDKEEYLEKALAALCGYGAFLLLDNL